MHDNSFLEIRFEPEIAYGASGGPEFFTDVITAVNGYEQRNINWFNARNKYNLAPSIKTKEQLGYLINFFRQCRGRAIGFRFKDWSDYQIKDQIIAIADGARREFQIIKTYGEVTRKIVKPVEGTIKIFCNNLKVDAEINHLNGIIKFDEEPAEGVVIKCEGEFDVAVRFDIDHLVTSIENYGVYSHNEIPLIEVKI